MTEKCFVCGTEIHDWSEALSVIPYPCYLAAHKKCAKKFINAFKRYYGFKIDLEKMQQEFNKQWGFEIEKSKAKPVSNSATGAKTTPSEDSNKL